MQFSWQPLPGAPAMGVQPCNSGVRDRAADSEFSRMFASCANTPSYTAPQPPQPSTAWHAGPLHGFAVHGADASEWENAAAAAHSAPLPGYSQPHAPPHMQGWGYSQQHDQWHANPITFGQGGGAAALHLPTLRPHWEQPRQQRQPQPQQSQHQSEGGGAHRRPSARELQQTMLQRQQRRQRQRQQREGQPQRQQQQPHASFGGTGEQGLEGEAPPADAVEAPEHPQQQQQQEAAGNVVLEADGDSASDMQGLEQRNLRLSDDEAEGGGGQPDVAQPTENEAEVAQNEGAEGRQGR